MSHTALQIIMGEVAVASTSGLEEIAVTLNGAWPGLYVIEE
jgi:hypothetical protein